MALYAIAFDLDTKEMRVNGFDQSAITRVYQREIPEALKNCGFTAHPQGSLYHTETEQDPLIAIMNLKSTLQQEAPSFCRYVRRVHVFRMEEWSDVTAQISNRPSNGPPTPEEELEEQEAMET